MRSKRSRNAPTVASDGKRGTAPCALASGSAAAGNAANSARACSIAASAASRSRSAASAFSRTPLCSAASLWMRAVVALSTRKQLDLRQQRRIAERAQPRRRLLLERAQLDRAVRQILRGLEVTAEAQAHVAHELGAERGQRLGHDQLLAALLERGDRLAQLRALHVARRQLRERLAPRIGRVLRQDHDRTELGALLDQAPALGQPGQHAQRALQAVLLGEQLLAVRVQRGEQLAVAFELLLLHAEAVGALALLAHLAPRVFVRTHGLIQQPLAARAEQLVGFLRQRVQRLVDAGRAGAGLEQALAQIAVTASELLAADAQAFVVEAEHAREHRLRQTAEHARELGFVGGLARGIEQRVLACPCAAANASSCPRASTRRAPMRRFGPVCRCASRLWCSMPYRSRRSRAAWCSCRPRSARRSRAARARGARNRDGESRNDP